MTTAHYPDNDEMVSHSPLYIWTATGGHAVITI